MPNYRFNDAKNRFYEFLNKNKKLGRAAILRFYRVDMNKGDKLTMTPALSTLYKWYNAR